MSFYYVDFENVGKNGVNGIEKLTQDDCVTIYYSNNPNIDMKTVINLFQTPAKLQFFKLLDSINLMNRTNALDIILLADISRIAQILKADDYAYIISNDKGYDPAIQEINEIHHFKNILRKTSIASPDVTKTITKSSFIDEIKLNQLFEKQLSKFNTKKNIIIQIVTGSKSRCEINNKIVKHFTNEQTKLIMSALKPIIQMLPGQ